MQKQPKILNYKNLNKTKYEYLQPHKTQGGYYQSICNYRLTKNQLLPFYLETPKLKTTSGIVRIDNNYYIDLELPQTGEGGYFYDFLIQNDENNISTCHSNSKEWFNQVMPLNIVENYYKTAILLRSNGNLPVIRIKIPSYKGNILTEIFNSRKEKINDISCIQEGDLIVGIIEYTGLKFMKQNFSPCYELQKIKIFKDNDFRSIPSGYIFSDTDENINLEKIPIAEIDTMLEHPIEHFCDKDSINNTDEYKSINLKKPIPIIPSPQIQKKDESIKLVADNTNNNTDNNNNITVDNTIFNSPEPKTKEDTIVKIDKIDTIDNIETILSKSPEPIINSKHKPISMQEDTPNKPKMNKLNKTLYDMVKATTLEDLYIDDKLFNNNIKLFNNTKKQSENNNTFVNNEFSDISNIKIGDIENIDLNVDYDLDSPHSTSPTIITGDEDGSGDEEDDSIDYDTLNDLEVIQFE